LRYVVVVSDVFSRGEVWLRQAGWVMEVVLYGVPVCSGEVRLGMSWCGRRVRVRCARLG
jgi:hypothetical protein